MYHSTSTFDPASLGETAGAIHGLELVRFLGPQDHLHLRAFFLGLSPDDRYCRFQTAASDTFLDRYAMTYDFNRMFAVGLFVAGRLEAVGELVLPVDPMVSDRAADGAGEIAIAVRSPLRGQGWGSRLGAMLKLKALSLGLGNVHASYLPANAPMRRIGRGMGMFERRGSDDITASATLP